MGVADREQLEAWIAQSRRTQQRLRYALVPAALAALAVLMWSRPLGALCLVSVAIVATFGFWITGGHITEWETKIRNPPKPPELNQYGRRRRERD